MMRTEKPHMCLLSTAAIITGDEGAVIEEQQQLLQSIHAMISNLKAEKQSHLGMLSSSQVCCCLLAYHAVQSYSYGCAPHGLMVNIAAKGRGMEEGRAGNGGEAAGPVLGGIQAGLSMLASCVFMLSPPFS